MKKDFSARELAQAHLDVVAEKDADIHAYIEVYDDVLAQADIADKRIASGDVDTLTGIPLAIKDNILISGRKVSAASKILENYHATYDAHVIGLLKKANSVFLGRTNMDEFAMGGSTEHSAYGVTRNPYDLSRVPGGSSGGSAAAVAMGGALAALGSDTGGSVRQPASFCGVVGLKPTYGALSRSGLIAMGSSLDQIGPITKTVSDAEILFKHLRVHDPKDSTSLPAYTQQRSDGKLTIGIPYDFLEKGVDREVRRNFDASVKKLENMGYSCTDIKLPHVKHSLAIYYIIMPAEASTNLARFDGVRYGMRASSDTLLAQYVKTRGAGFGAEVKRRIVLGAYVLSSGYYDAYYNKANSVRNLVAQDFDTVFGANEKRVHAIMTPTAPTPAFPIGERTADPLQMYLADIFTVPANIVGVPALAVPSGVTERGKLPFGVQFMAPHMREDTLFRIGKDFLGEQQ
ncbi:MAG: aspartyl-tRNA(Asn)/glutamyl-tRNA (Gln) amidotransferase subunit A [Parcubacteria group bacterium Greene1014_15]|nr:MAG: aspartyl-tRNA(Asn)/glutamyl-tRNA (Gln) amidotransferase subunit A [Parcubacteria group bacterium Greene1014_15]